MKIVQVLANYKRDDGVGSVAWKLDTLFSEAGYDSKIIGRLLVNEDIDSEIFDSKTVVFYHLGTNLDPVISHLKCRKVLVFHNISYPELLEGVDEDTRLACSAGKYEVPFTKDIFEYAICFSDFSRNDLINAGWDKDRVFSLPISIDFSKLECTPDQNVIKKYNDGFKNIVFMGRVFTNKKIEDIIAAFASYKIKYETNSRLFLVGSKQSRLYYESLVKYAEKLGVSGSVFFTGFVTREEYAAYYKIADLFLCMSGHEGFCIPLVEAMYMNVPVMAYNATAVPDTLNGTGYLLDTRDPDIAAENINRIMMDDEYRKSLLSGEVERLAKLRAGSLDREYNDVIRKILGNLSGQSNIVAQSDRNDREKFRLLPGLLYNSGKFSEALGDKKVVIYGAGAAGERIIVQLFDEIGKDRVVLADKGKAGGTDPERGIPIISPEDVIEGYRDSLIVISIQDHSIVRSVAEDFIGKGISFNDIFFYHINGNCIW